MSKKWLIGVIGTTVIASMVLGGCRAVRDEMDGASSSTTTTTTTTASSVTSTTSSSSAASTTGSSATTSSTSGGLMDEITNVQ